MLEEADIALLIATAIACWRYSFLNRKVRFVRGNSLRFDLIWL